MRHRWLTLLAAFAAACGSSAPAPPRSILDVEQTSLTLYASPDGEEQGEELDAVSDDGDGSLAEPTTTIHYGSGDGWLEASVSGSKAPYVISVKPAAGSLPVGTYTASISVAADGAANSPQTVAVTLQVVSELPRTLSGVIAYEKVSPFTDAKATPRGLDYGRTTWEKVRDVEVELLDAATDKVIERSRTDGAGRYRFAWASGQNLVKVRAFARSVKPRIRVQDNTLLDKTKDPPIAAPYAGTSAPFDASKGSTLDVRFGSGWVAGSPGSYAGSRSAAPFAVLDAAYSAATKFLVDRPAIAFPDLAIHWSVKNRPEGDFTVSDYEDGRINTSHWSSDRKGLYILGKEDVDTDEYDSHIIVHEWGHYMESMVSRSDTPGNSHAFGERKDPRLAWGEGWATALGGIVFHPNTFYVDTKLEQQATSSIFFDIEDNLEQDPIPGWFSETTVLHVFYDLWDPPRDPDGEKAFDQVQLPLGALYDVMANAQRNTPAFTTLFSFIDALRKAHPGQQPAIDKLLAHRDAVSTVQDRYGRGEKNDGKLPLALPVYTELKVDSAPVKLGFIGRGTDPVKEFFANELETCRLAFFQGTGGAVTLTVATTGVGVRVALHEGSSELGWFEGAVPGDKDDKGVAKPLTREVSFAIETKAGTPYRMLVVSTGKKDDPIAATVTLSPQ